MTTPELEHTAPSAESVKPDFHVLLRDKVCLAVQLMLNEVMDWELEAVIGAALYERTADTAAIIGMAVMSGAW